MKILQVCLKPPYPKVDGGCMAIAAITESLLLAKHEVKCLTIATHKHPFKEDKIPQSVLDSTKMEAVKLDTRIKAFDAFVNLFQSSSYNINRFYDEDFETRLTEIVRETKFDTIILESVFCTPYIAALRKATEAKIAVRTHNVEYHIWRNLAEGQSNIVKGWYMNLLAKRLKRYELSALNKVDGILAITETDKSAMISDGITTPISVIPIGMDIKRFPIPKKTSSLSLYHVGSMDWEPNIEGIDWFLEDVWPLINSTYPNLECHLAGRNMPDDFLEQNGATLHISAEIDSVLDFVKDKPISIVPLLSGSGMRVKIVEALALGKVIISTSLGATGIPYTDGENILIADSPEEFVEKLNILVQDPSQITRIGRNARKLAEAEFDLQSLSSKLTYFCRELSKTN